MMGRLAVLGLLFFVSVTASADDCSSLDDLSWMAGYWESRSSGTLMTEQWTRISPQTAEGVGEVRTLTDRALKSRETLRLVSMSGSLYYLAKVSHNPLPVAFGLTRCGKREAVFENPDHDFPTRIAYRRTEGEQLLVEVSGADGKGFSIRFDAAAPPKRIALTFDDAPRPDSAMFTGLERTQRLLAGLAAVNAPPVMFFAVGQRIDAEGDQRLRMYQATGNHIANHSFSHQRIASMGVDAYIEDIERAHEVLSGYQAFVPLFRFPFLDEGANAETRDRLRATLAEMGYRNGYVTVDNYDWYMDHLLQKAILSACVPREEELGAAYVNVIMDAVNFYDDIAGRYLDSTPTHVLLLHENDLAAMYVDELVGELREQGWALVDALEAFEDPIAMIEPDTLFNGQGRVAAIAETRGARRRDLVHAAEDEAYLERLFSGKHLFISPSDSKEDATCGVSD